MEPAPQAIIDQLQQKHDAVRARVLTANSDLAERFTRIGGTVYYDPEDDWLILTIGQAVPAVTLELDDDLNLRYDSDTLAIVALETPSVAAYVAAHPEMTKTIRALQSLALTAPGTYVAIPRADSARVAHDLRELVGA
jgi:hypothetical protein